MTNTSKTIIGLTLFEVALTAYFFYVQPQCEPCLPNIYCPPCISKAQIIALWTGLIIAVIAIIYLFFSNYSRQLKT